MSYLSDCYREAADERDSLSGDLKELRADLKLLMQEYIATFQGLIKLNSLGKTLELEMTCQDAINELKSNLKAL